MLRQTLVYLIISVIVVLFARYAQLLIVYIDMRFAFINIKTNPSL